MKRKLFNYSVVVVQTNEVLPPRPVVIYEGYPFCAMFERTTKRPCVQCIAVDGFTEKAEAEALAFTLTGLLLDPMKEAVRRYCSEHPTVRCRLLRGDPDLDKDALIARLAEQGVSIIPTKKRTKKEERELTGNPGEDDPVGRVYPGPPYPLADVSYRETMKRIALRSKLNKK